jgi:hypothetical protein
MADNPYVQVAPSVPPDERFVVPFTVSPRLDGQAERCYGAHAAAGLPPEADGVLL